MRWGAVLGVGALLAFAPAARANELEIAYDYYQPGQGFQIGLKAADGTAIPLPAGVNTADDELHPALSPDGRFLVFTRMRLQPKLNGDFLVPAQRNLVWVDLQTGQIPPFPLGAGGAGPTFTLHGTTVADLAWGVPAGASPAPDGITRLGSVANGNEFPTSAVGINMASGYSADMYFPHVAEVRSAFFEPIDNAQCGPHCQGARDLRMFSTAFISPVSGAVELVEAGLLEIGPRSGSTLTPTILRAVALADGSHPVARGGDHFIALDRDGDIHTITFPGAVESTVAPAPITTADPERMPAWSPSALQLGFVRTTKGRRHALIYDLTPGIQSIVSDLDLGPDAPTSQTQAFQSVWGGLALANRPAAPGVTCDAACQAAIAGRNLTPLVSSGGLQIGIFVARRTGGTHTVLGVREPRIKAIGRVPLGAARKGRNHFHWNGRVNGKRLKPGNYLLTLRLLRHGNVATTSKSIPFRVRG